VIEVAPFAAEPGLATIALGPPMGDETGEFIPLLAGEMDSLSEASDEDEVTDPGSPGDSLTLELDEDDEEDEGADSISDALKTVVAPPSLGEPSLSDEAAPIQSVATRAPDRRSSRPMVLVGMVVLLGIGGGLWATRSLLQSLAEDATEKTEGTDRDDDISLASADEEEESPEALEDEDKDTEASEDQGSDPDSAEGKDGGTSGVKASGTASVSQEKKTEKQVSTPAAATTTPVAQKGKVQINGDIDKAVLISSRGKRLSPGKVPVGTYDLEVSFSSGETITRTNFVKVSAGKTTRVTCSSISENCRAQ
jgi:cytoskeletal protein RodZ